MLRLPCLAVALAVLLSGALVPAAVAAAPSEKEARTLFQRAEISFNLGKFQEALTDYQAAYEAKHLSGFLFNIAQCYRNLGNYERARFFFRRYLALDPRTSNRPLVEDLIAEMTRLLDKQEAAAATPPAAVTVTPAAVAAPPPAPEALLPLPAAAEPVPETAPAATLVAAPAPAPARRPVYKRWWFWTAAGAAVAGGVVAAFLLTRSSQPTGSLSSIDGR